MSQADVAISSVGWVSDSVTQQFNEPDLKLSGSSEMSGYAALTRPTMIDTLECNEEVIEC